MMDLSYKRVKTKVQSVYGYWTNGIRFIFYNFLNRIGYFDDSNKISTVKFGDEWEKRIAAVIKSEFNESIPRVFNAGIISEGYQVMHNGLLVASGGYYGLPIAKMLFLNKGVHEPEEEKIFNDILKTLPNKPVMIEMGAYWSFYSMWFLKEVNQGVAFMIEPEDKNIKMGMLNFQKNNFVGSFHKHALSDTSSTNGGLSTVTLDDFIEQHGIKHLNIAHADIQGFELRMLTGASKSLDKKIIDYFFISTHTKQLHNDCLIFLNNKGYNIICNIDMDNISSLDGLLVAVSPVKQ